MDISLSKLPWYTQVGVFVVLSLAACGVFYYYYVTPANEAAAVKEQELNALRADITKGLVTARKLPEFQKEVAALEGRLDNLKSVLPEEKDVADLLRRIQTLAAQSNLAIKGFKPEPIATKQLHAEWPIALELDGTYHNLGLFFDRISKFSRIINVSTVHIRAKERPDAQSTITAQCVATTFVLLDPKAAAKPAAPGVKR
jgi:type IV pilus assembly protein PilO